jgi:hypothetical protein
VIPALREALGPGELAVLMAEGGTWSEDEAAAPALLV